MTWIVTQIWIFSQWNFKMWLHPINVCPCSNSTKILTFLCLNRFSFTFCSCKKQIDVNILSVLLLMIKSSHHNFSFLSHRPQDFDYVTMQFNERTERWKSDGNLLNESCLFLLIIYMKNFLHSDWLRAVQFFSKTVQKRVNSVHKEETNQAFWLVNDQRNLQIANQIFCFQIKRTPWMAQLMA